MLIGVLVTVVLIAVGSIAGWLFGRWLGRRELF